MTTKSSIITACYELLLGDSSIQAFFDGEVVLALDQARDNQAFPYLVHTFESKPEDWPMNTGRYAVSCYCAGRKADVSLELAQRVKEIFQWRYLATDEVKVGRFFFVDDPAMPTGDKEVWRTDVIFDFRFYDQKTALAVISR